MPDTWREGFRTGDPDDICPGCLNSGCLLAGDFKKFGNQSLRACVHCGGVYLNGKRTAELQRMPPAVASPK